MIFKGKKKKDISSKEEHNQKLIRAIQPSGNLLFKESYIRKGDGYEACVFIHEYPTHVNEFWLYEILNMNNVITTVDISDSSKPEIIKGINSSLKEQLDRFYNDKDQVEKISAESKYKELTQMFDEISRQGESIKYVNTRIYVSGKTLSDLEERVKEVLENLEVLGCKGAVLLNETKYEWQSMTMGYKESCKLPNQRTGREMGARTIAAGYPYHFTKLEDPNGTFLGTTFTGGNVLFDLFHKDNQRRYYNGILVGTMGAGKSTALKKITLDNACRGNIIRGIDVTGEFQTMVKELGGKMISLDGSQGIINPLQILKIDEDEEISFTKHLSKFTTFFQFLSPKVDDETKKEFELLARDFYIECGIYKPGEPNQNLTNRGASGYPPLRVFHKYILNKLYKNIEKKIINENLTASKTRRLENIELTINNLVSNYGKLFDGISSIEDITDEQIVFFSIRNLTSMKKEIFNAQMFNILNLLWDNMLGNGTHYKDLFDKKQIAWEDITRYLIVIDEAHRLINTENILAVKFLEDFEREARKYFGGLLFVSQSIRDFVPEGTAEGVNSIKTLFELTQYKFIMQQDANAQNALRTIFENQLSESELSQITSFRTGECILAINGQSNITFTVEASQEELDMFTGGA